MNFSAILWNVRFKPNILLVICFLFIGNLLVTKASFAQVKKVRLSEKYKTLERKASKLEKQTLSNLRLRSRKTLRDKTFVISNTSVVKYIGRDVQLITGAVLPPASEFRQAPPSASSRVSNIRTGINPNARSLDLRAKGLVSSVRDQSRCGSCWAFCATACIETAHILRNQINPNNINLSEQYALSCSGAGSCRGGQPHKVYRHLKNNGKGFPQEASFRYNASDQSCPARPSFTDFKVEQWGWVGRNNRQATVREVKNSLSKYGAVDTYIWVNSSFAAYANGVINDDSRNGWGGWHCVQICGWDDNRQAYLIKNSWGRNWGQNGFGWVKYNVLSIGSFSAWVVAKKQNRIPKIAGTWKNKDANTRGITRLIIGGNGSTIHAFGSCSPRDCDWKKVSLKQTGSVYKAIYKHGFATRDLTLSFTSNGELKLKVFTNYHDNRQDRTATYYFRK